MEKGKDFIVAYRNTHLLMANEKETFTFRGPPSAGGLPVSEENTHGSL